MQTHHNGNFVMISKIFTASSINEFYQIKHVFPLNLRRRLISDKKNRLFFRLHMKPENNISICLSIENKNILFMLTKDT